MLGKLFQWIRHTHKNGESYLCSFKGCPTVAEGYSLIHSDSLGFSQLAETGDALRLLYANQNKFLINKEILPLKSRENHAGEEQLYNIFLSVKAALTFFKEFRKCQKIFFSHAPNQIFPPHGLHRMSCWRILVLFDFSNEESSNFMQHDYFSICLSRSYSMASERNCSSFHSFWGLRTLHFCS